MLCAYVVSMPKGSITPEWQPPSGSDYPERVRPSPCRSTCCIVCRKMLLRTCMHRGARPVRLPEMRSVPGASYSNLRRVYVAGVQRRKSDQSELGMRRLSPKLAVHEEGPVSRETGPTRYRLIIQLSEPGANTSIIRLRSSTLANSMLTRPLRAPSEIFTFVSRRSESDEAR